MGVIFGTPDSTWDYLHGDGMEEHEEVLGFGALLGNQMGNQG